MERHNRERWYRMATSWLAAAPHPHSKTSSHAGLYIWCNFGRWHVKYKTSRTVDFSWTVVHLSPTKIILFFLCILILFVVFAYLPLSYKNSIHESSPDNSEPIVVRRMCGRTLWDLKCHIPRANLAKDRGWSQKHEYKWFTVVGNSGLFMLADFLEALGWFPRPDRLATHALVSEHPLVPLHLQ